MPKNFKTGTPHKKTRACPLCEDHRTRNLDLHMKEEHGIADMATWYRTQFERSGQGLDTVYDRQIERSKP